MEFTIDNLQVLITAKKYFDNEVSEADSPLFPDVDTVSNNLVCSFLEGDRRRKYGDKIPVTLTNQIMDEFSLHIKSVVKKKPNKPEICFLIYMLQNIAINQPAQEGVLAEAEHPARLAEVAAVPAAPAAGLEGLPLVAPLRTKKKGGAPPVEKNIYNTILEANKINLEKISKKGKELYQDLTRAIYNKNYDRFLKALETYVDLPKDSAKEKLEEIERILSEPHDSNNNDYAQIKIVDLFIIRNEDLRIDINSVYYKFYEYVDNKKNIISNLYTFLKDNKKLFTQDTGDQVKYIKNVLKDLNPNHCTLLSQDDPNIPYDPSVPPEQNMTRLFKDYNLTEIDKFVNINNGYCFTQEYLTAMLIAYRGSLTHAEVSLVPRGNKLTELVEKLAVYYTSGTEEEKLEKQKDDIIDGLALYSIKELEYIIKHFGESCPVIFKDIHKKINDLGEDKDGEEQKNFRFAAECKNLLEKPISKPDLTKFFTFMLSGGLKDAANMDKVKAIYNYSCNTIFELIGLAGYTLFSDMITQVHNVDGNMFSISTYCIAQMEHLRQELEKIKNGTGDKDNLAEALNEITFGAEADQTSYQSILKSAETQCIHGVGRRCLDYYLRAYEAMQGFAQTLRPVLPPAPVPPPAQVGGIKPIPDEILASEDAANEAIEKMFALAPYLVRVPLDIERSTSIRYLTCFAHDDDTYSRQNPNNHCYVISGFTTDLRFIHVLHAKYNNYRTLVYDNNNLSIKDSFNIISSDVYYTITPHNGLTYNAEYIEKANILAGYYNDPKNIMEFNKLLRIPYTFHRHRKATFKAFKDYTLHICKLMAEHLNEDNEDNENTTKYSTLRTFTTDYKLTDYITMDELPLLPKHMTFLDLRESNNTPNKNVSKKMWNTGFNTPDSSNLEEINKNYYIDTLENFLSLGYNQELIQENGEDNKIAIIKTPETRKNVTRSYQFAQLLGKILCNNNFNRIMVPIEESYKYFNNYFLNAAGQVSSFIDAPFKDINFFIVLKGERKNINKSNAMIYTKNISTNTPDIKIIAACIQNINTFSAIGYHAKYIAGEYFTNVGKDNEEAVKRIRSFFEDEVDRRMELIFTLFKIFFVIIPPNADNDTYFMKIREYIRIKSSTAFNTRNYKTMFQSIIDIMCSEGNMQSGYKYHFTELDKEFYLLKEIHKEFQSAAYDQGILPTSISTKDDVCINIMIGILNTKFAYFNPSDQDTDVKLETNPDNIEYIQDAKSLAIEYINKTELISMHALRMYVFWIFERIVIKLSSMEYYYGDSFFELEKEDNEFATEEYITAQSNIETKFRGILDFEFEEIGIHSMLRELKRATPDKLEEFLNIMQDEVI